MRVVTIDFETYWSAEYTLSKMTTEAYVRDPRFKTHMVGVKCDDGATVVLTDAQFRKFLDGGLRRKLQSSALLCQNTMFDGFILAHHYNVVPAFYLDTMSMFRMVNPHKRASLKVIAETLGLTAKGGASGYSIVNTRGLTTLDPWQFRQCAEYCKLDVDLAYAAYQILKVGYPIQELKLIDLTIRMFTHPVLELDADILTAEVASERDRKRELMRRIGEDSKTLSSSAKFATLLTSLGVTPPVKPSPTALKNDKELHERVVSIKAEGVKLTPAICEELEIPWTYAFGKSDQEFKHLLNHDDPMVVAAVEARIGVKSTIAETRAARFLSASERGAFPVPLAYWGAATGRWSGCLVANTEIVVYDWGQGVTTKNIVDVQDDDLVWDGEEFVSHQGVVFQGYKEVISHDGITGTPNHPVFISEEKTISLSSALRRGTPIMAGTPPTDRDVCSISSMRPRQNPSGGRRRKC